MKRLLALLLLLELGSTGYAQTPAWSWVLGSGGGNYQYGFGLATGTAGNIYIGGRLAGTATLGGQTGTAGGAATIFMGRFNNAGTFSWLSTQVYSAGFDYMNGYSLDRSNNSYSTGIINSGGGIFINRYNSAGVQTWNTTVSGGGSPIGYGVVADQAGNIYATGTYSGAITFGSTTLNVIGGGADIYLVRYNNAGVVQWAVRAGGTGYDAVRGMTIDPAGNVYICGGYTGAPSFGSFAPPASSGFSNFFIAKYDPSGTPLWVTTASSAGISNGGWSEPSAITIDSCGSLYVTGHFQSTALFGSQSVTSAGGDDIFVAKCLSNGNWEWVKSAGGSAGDYGAAIALDKDFDVYIAGYFSGAAQFGSQSITSAGAMDCFVAKYANSTGDLQWVQRAGGTSDDQILGITVDNAENVYVTGSFSGTTVFGASAVTATGPGNTFVARLDTVPERKITVVLNSPYCTGSVIVLPFTVTGSFNAGNVFTAQLSDVNGSFVTPLNIGSVTGTGSGTINITIPPGTAPGSNYIIRVVSSVPAWSSFDYCQRISIIGPCAPVILNGDSTALDTVHCYEDVNRAILGVPGGGTFSGCGIVSSGGGWYFNSAQAAAGVTTWPHQCRIVYRLPGGDSAARMMTVQKPVVVDLGGDKTGCTGDTFTLQSSVAYGGAGYQWSTGSGAPSVSTGQSGIYWLEVLLNGCTGRDTVTVTVHSRPEVHLGNDTGICDRDVPLILSSPQPVGTQYLWSTGLSTPSINVTRTDTYWLEATLGDCKESDTVLVKVIATPSVHIGNDSFICEGQPANIGAIVPGATYLWNTGSTESSIEVSESGSYWLTSDLEGCKVSDTVLITVMPLPAPDLGPDRDICPEQVIVLDAAYPGGRYQWSTGDTTASLPVSNPGIYWVKVLSAYGCAGRDTVTFNDYPLPVVLLGADTTVCEEQPLLLQPFYTNSDSLRWSDGSAGSSLAVTAGGLYIVSGINKCGETRDTIEIKQIFCDIWVPNAFTPNGDGINDVFKVLGNTGRLEGFRLRVFNRWGQLLFETVDRTKGWDGGQRGGEALLGVYTYMLEYSLQGKPVLQKGNFTLLR